MVAGQTPYIHFGFVPSLGVDAIRNSWFVVRLQAPNAIR
jgi:hypothetical protein